MRYPSAYQRLLNIKFYLYSLQSRLLHLHLRLVSPRLVLLSGLLRSHSLQGMLP
ncbi:hypothetical protein NT05LM_3214 [Listeria marthii FSL S4-120]|uniref:Uncharacterized protein n=1 Tax=Listeria marthii FSL S4-120 TaxID=702457 RepID=A0ABN0BTU9_9LIST|nr:hypothetical protein NT05LM_3214 [Listeria marthii FSL S4-120]